MIALGARGVRGVVLDIEGTTTPVSFVTDVLFPYARAHAAAWLSRHLGTPAGHELVRLLAADHAAERDGTPPPFSPDNPDAIAGFVAWQMDRDRKSTGLKALQGKIWEEGYRSGALRGDVYPDVPAALRQWHDQDLLIAIYSSGSVLAQRLLLGSTPYGDLTPLIDAYFDTRVGPKREAASYRRIAHEIRLPPTSILFISDVDDELRAAAEAGFMTLLAIRPGNAARPRPGRESVRSFAELAA